MRNSFQLKTITKTIASSEEDNLLGQLNANCVISFSQGKPMIVHHEQSLD
jgi:hypothetical protein